MFEQLRSRDRQYYEAAVEMTTHIREAATHLRALFAAPAELEQHAAEIDALVRAADRVRTSVQSRLDSSFITPIDREDIHDLAWELDRVAHLIGETARRSAVYHITEWREPAVRLADVLIRACERLEGAITHVRQPAQALEWREAVKQLEEEADEVYTEAVGALFADPPTPLEVLKWKDLYDLLEDAVDGCDHAASAVGHVAIAQL
jgi:uncharacterized protein Yka (UPF0111/DUF47 family)